MFNFGFETNTWNKKIGGSFLDITGSVSAIEAIAVNSTLSCTMDHVIQV